MNYNENISDLIDRYNSGELNESERADFLARLQTDPELRVQVSIDRTVTKMLEKKELLKFMEKISKIRGEDYLRHNRTNRVLMAASILLLLSIGLFTLFFYEWGYKDNQNNRGFTWKRDARPVNLNLSLLDQADRYQRFTPAPRGIMHRNTLLANAFQPLVEYELLVGSATRSESFQLLSPKTRISMPKNSVVSFQWKTATEWLPITLEVIDNQGISVRGPVPVQGGCYQLTTDDLGTGLFYWRITSDEGLILMGNLILY